jgi:hypothetical protein
VKADQGQRMVANIAKKYNKASTARIDNDHINRSHTIPWDLRSLAQMQLINNTNTK